MGNDKKKRDGFDSQIGFILACIGSAVGMGNIWRFPVMVSKWGGMTFLLPYFICVFIVGTTGVLGEMAFGRAAKAGPIGAFGMATERKFGNRKLGEAIGMIPIVGAMMLAIGYTCVVGWIFKYMFMSLSGDLAGLGQDMDKIGGMFGSTAAAFSNNLWIIIALIVNFAIMVMGVAGGIEKANKVMMPVLFGLFIILAIYIATIPGASDGYKYIFTITPSMLLNPKLWIYAFGQAFFSLSVAGNGTVIYGSYLKDDEDVIQSSRIVAVMDTVAALLAAFVIVPSIATTGGELSSGGPGLMFIHLVHVFNGMRGGRIVTIIFYLCVLFAGVSSLINLYEAPVAALQEKLGFDRKKAVAIIAIVGCVVALCIQGIVSGWMDFVSNYLCPLGAFLAGVMFFWFCGRQFVEAEINKGSKSKLGDLNYNVAKYVYCVLCLVALIAGIILGGIG